MRHRFEWRKLSHSAVYLLLAAWLYNVTIESTFEGDVLPFAPRLTAAALIGAALGAPFNLGCLISILAPFAYIALLATC